VDLAVGRCDPRAPRDTFALRLELLSRLEESVAPAPLDLVVADEAPALLRERIARDGVPLFSRHRRYWVRFRVRAWKESFDERPLRAIFHRALKKRLEEGTFGRR
jgi:hypothetical protein